MNSQPNKHKNIPRDITIYCNLLFKKKKIYCLKSLFKKQPGVGGGEAHYLQGKEFINLHQNYHQKMCETEYGAILLKC